MRSPTRGGKQLKAAGRTMMRRAAYVIVGTLALAAAPASMSTAQDQVTLGYDDLGRLTSVCHGSSGQLDTYKYDPAGNRSSVTATAGACLPTLFSISDATAVTEGLPLTFTVTRTGATSGSHAVSYATASGTATAGSDYTAIPATTLTFAAGETSKTVTVTTINDTVFESNETVLVNLSNPTGGATIADSQGSGTINDNDVGASFVIANAAAVAEGTSLAFTVTRSGDTSGTNAVNYATANGTATAGSDYTAASGTLTFTAGQISKTVTVATVNDTVYESDETVLVNLSTPTNGATISVAQGSGAINNNDAAPSFTISDASATAGSALSFTVTKSGSTALSHGVNYATANGTGVAGAQYTAASGTLTFTSGQTSQTISVNTTAGGVTSGSKSMVVNLSAATGGATIADSQGSGTINAPATNIPPVAVNDTVSGVFTQFDSVDVYVLSNDTDSDGDPLTVTAASCASTGCFVSNAGSHITVTGTTIGTKTVNYTISDGKGGTASATATVNKFYDSGCALC